MDFKKLKNLHSDHWFEVKNASDDTAEVRIDGVIGGEWYDDDSVQAKKFIEEFNKIGSKSINLHINSPGGSVYDGFAIYNALVASKKAINVHVDGIAASIASVIAMSGDSINMPENTYMMIHNPWTFTMGNADQLRQYADELDDLGEKIAKIYADRSGKDIKEVKALMKGENGADGTFIDANTALEMGLCTNVTENKKAAACIGLDAFDNLPESLRKINSATQKRSLEDSLRDVGYSAAQAKAIASGKAQLATRDEAEPVNSKSDMLEILNELKNEFKKGTQK